MADVILNIVTYVIESSLAMHIKSTQSTPWRLTPEWRTMSKVMQVMVELEFESMCVILGDRISV